VSLAVQARGLEVRVPDGRLVLGPLDLDLREGAWALVCGPSGSGKTTLLRALAGLARPSAGTLELFGTQVHAGRRELVPAQARGVGMLFQGGALWPHLGARRTLEFVLAHRGVPRAQRRARAAALLAEVELSGFDERLPGSLSGGEAQRLALARALAMQPRLLLLDEPLGPLDRPLRAALLERLGDLRARLGLTVLHVTHDPDEARALADARVQLAAGGRMEVLA
jgi:ABC-type Fe3+/spermidine/putrescine transport system ATPase subunit